MITRNFIPAISFARSGSVGATELNRIDGTLDNITWNGGSGGIDDFYYGLYTKKSSHNGPIANTPYGIFVFVGNGTTVATKDDVNLESHIPYSDTGLCVKTSDASFIRSPETFLIFTVTLENKTDSSITITEDGLFFRPHDGNYLRFPYNYMLARETFDPVTIGSGQIKTLTMTIKI